MFILTILLTALLIGFAVSGFDDVLIDLVYWYRRLGDRQDRGLRLGRGELMQEAQKRIAIVTATWHEYDVIEEMLRFNVGRIDYENYDFIIGTYPNDERTQESVDNAVRTVGHVVKAVNPRAGPTSKADCLNAVMDVIRARERELGIEYEIILLHDPEDVHHPLELRLYNRIFTSRPDVDMVQTPIYPFAVGTWEFTAGAYMDEFAEQHTKNLYAREWAGAFIPSAGVATAIRREALERIGEGGLIFGTDSLTEDYEMGLRIALGGMNAIFVRQLLEEEVNGKLRREVIATRANFPHTYTTAVRQRTRWTLGIVFQARKHFGWSGDWRVKWILFHDRKGPWSYALVAAGYGFVAYVSVYSAIQRILFPEWDAPVVGNGVLGWGLVFGFGMMTHRTIQQIVATTRVYGARQGLLSVLRHPWATLINLIATFRALKQFRRSQRTAATLTWDKTQHFVPQHVKNMVANAAANAR